MPLKADLHIFCASTSMYVEHDLSLENEGFSSHERNRCSKRKISAFTSGADPDEAVVEGLVREFAASWKSGIEAINQDVKSFFSNFRNGMEILKQVRTR